MDANYIGITEEAFREAFFAKDLVILFLRDDQTVVGFTTMSFNIGGTQTEAYNIVYSGDTIMDPEYWGSNIVHRAFLGVAGAFMHGNPGKKLYWLLLSSSHRTYMYLPLGFKTYYPAAVTDRHASHLAGILDTCAQRMFGPCWDKRNGLVHFDFDGGDYTVNALRPEHCEATYRLAHKQHVRFFLEKNPGFNKGVELACMAEYSKDNLFSRWHPYFEERVSDGSLRRTVQVCSRRNLH